jgi:hypothetical protein
VTLLFIGGHAMIATAVNPVEVTEYAVVLSVVFPFTYLPLLRAARRPRADWRPRQGSLGMVLRGCSSGSSGS